MRPACPAGCSASAGTAGGGCGRFPARKIRPGSTVLSLKLGRLAAGSDRLVVTASKSGIKQASAKVSFKVSG